MKFLRSLATAAALAASPTLLGATPAAASTTSPALTRSAHVSYEGCPAKDVVLTVTLAHRTYDLGQSVRYRIRLHNLSAKSCGMPGSTAQRTVHGPVTGLVGPCRPISLAVEDAKGAQVYPTEDAISCAALLGPDLGPHETMSVWNTWDRIESGLRPARLPTAVPAGVYRLVVDGRITIPFVLSNLTPPASFTADVRAAHSAHSAHATSQTRTGPVAFGGCPAHDILMKVTLDHIPAGSRLISYKVAVHNEGTTWCGPRHSDGPLYLGICGEISAIFRNAAGVNVDPGAEEINCPEFDGTGVAAHRTATGSATWPGDEFLPSSGPANQTVPAPPGRYTLVVAGTLTIAFTLTG